MDSLRAVVLSPPTRRRPPPPELAQARQHFFLPRRYRDPFGQTTPSSTLTTCCWNDLLMAREPRRRARQPRHGATRNDYRVLQPRLVSDPNRNRTEVAFDTLGMVVGTAVMGKPPPAPVEGDSLTGFVADLTASQLDASSTRRRPARRAPQRCSHDATTRIVYDLDRFRRTQQRPDDPTSGSPPVAATLARETHASDPLPASRA